MTRKRPCGKKIYRTKDEARTALAKMAKQYTFTFKRIYRCAACKGYHITSKPPPRPRRKQY